MYCFLFFSTYRNSISHIRITFAHDDCYQECACPRKGAAFTVDYCKRFSDLNSALDFISNLNNNYDCYIKTILPNVDKI